MFGILHLLKLALAKDFLDKKGVIQAVFYAYPSDYALLDDPTPFPEGKIVRITIEYIDKAQAD